MADSSWRGECLGALRGRGKQPPSHCQCRTCWWCALIGKNVLLIYACATADYVPNTLQLATSSRVTEFTRVYQCLTMPKSPRRRSPRSWSRSPVRNRRRRSKSRSPDSPRRRSADRSRESRRKNRERDRGRSRSRSRSRSRDRCVGSGSMCEKMALAVIPFPTQVWAPC